MDTIVDEIRNKMSKFPEARVEHDASSITYVPRSSNGFVVRLKVLKKHPCNQIYSVFYNGSHEEFGDRQSAIQAFALGLSTICRLREFSRGGQPYHWIVDLDDSLAWKPNWEIDRFCWAFLQFWRSPTVHYLQNRLIDFLSGSDPGSTAGELVPNPPGGGLPSLSAAQEIPKEKKSPDQTLDGYEPPPALC